jgi:hypothetical protein
MKYFLFGEWAHGGQAEKTPWPALAIRTGFFLYSRNRVD